MLYDKYYPTDPTAIVLPAFDADIANRLIKQAAVIFKWDTRFMKIDGLHNSATPLHWKRSTRRWKQHASEAAGPDRMDRCATRCAAAQRWERLCMPVEWKSLPSTRQPYAQTKKSAACPRVAARRPFVTDPAIIRLLGERKFDQDAYPKASVVSTIVQLQLPLQFPTAATASSCENSNAVAVENCFSKKVLF